MRAIPLFLLLLLSPVHAYGQDLSAEARASVAQAIYAAANTDAAFARARDGRLTEQRRRIEELSAQLAALGGRNASLEQLIADAQEQFVAELSQRDRAYAQEITAFRAALVRITATPTGLSALQHFNRGEEVAALAMLDDLRAAHDRARAEQRQRERQADDRRIALLLLEARARQALNGFTAAFPLIANTRDDVAREIDELIVAGDLARASRQLRVLIDSQQARVSADPASVDAQMDLALMHDRLGDIATAEGDFVEATARYQRTLEIARALAAESPDNALLQRAVGIALYKLARAPTPTITWQQVTSQFEAMEARGLLPQADAWVLVEVRRRAMAIEQHQIEH